LYLYPKWAEGFRLSLIEHHAGMNNVPLDVVLACIETESAGNAWAFRYEPTFKYTTRVYTMAAELKWSYISEETLQKSSFGLMQIMGAVARELGFIAELSQLFDPNTNLSFGCRYLKMKMDKYGNDKDAVAAYNAGSVIKTQGGFYINQGHINNYTANLDKIRNSV